MFVSAGYSENSKNHVASSNINVDSIEHSVVKVFSTTRLPDPFKPWSKQAPQEVTGSGVIIEGNRILTNAHVVLYANQIQIQTNLSGDKIAASVEVIAPGIDLAILKVDDTGFFASHPPVRRTSVVPKVKDAVMTYGFPAGGASLSITKGIVSRIEFAYYNYPVAGLRIQIDAAINPGNSGGPAVVGNTMIGVAFSRLAGGTENIGYIIPCEEVDLFLKDVADGKYDGKPALIDELQTFENPALRSFLKIDNSVTGIIVNRPGSSDAQYPLKQWDVITKIGDKNIDNQGMVTIESDLRVKFQYIIQNMAKNGSLPLTIVRKGKPLNVEIKVTSQNPLLIQDLQGTYPDYFIHGPLVFSIATTRFIASLNTMISYYAISGSPLITRLGDKPAFPDEQLVVISSPFFPHALVNGYDNPVARVVKSVNGISVRNLKHLVQILKDSKNDFDVIEYYGKGGESMVFPSQKIRASTDEILTDNGIRMQGSPSIMSVWDGQKGM
jgi:S1-C subfamily serine protease